MLDTTPATSPLPEGFPSLTTPSEASIPRHARQLRWYEAWLHENKIHFAAGQSSLLPKIKTAIRDAHALRWELAGDGTVPILTDEEALLLALPDDGDELAYQ